MKNRFLFAIVFAQLLFFSLSSKTFSQTESSITFVNGLTVAHMIEKGAGFSAGGSYNSKTNILYQFFFDENNKTYFGYDLEITPIANTTKFKLRFKPITGKPHPSWRIGKGFQKVNLPNLPREIIVTDGDIISLDIMENPKTKEKIKDFIIVTRKQSVGPGFAERHVPKDFTLDEVNLKLQKYEIVINGKNVYRSGGGGSGSNLAIYIRGKGRFIFSPFQRKGYDFKKIGTIINNKLVFSVQGDEYEIISESPMLGEGGKWHVWVKLEPDYVPPKGNPFPGNRVIVQSGSIERIFGKQN